MNGVTKVMLGDRFYRAMFFVAAVHNLIGGFLFLVFGDKIYTVADLAPPEPGIHYQTWVGLVFVFGAMYYMIFRDMFASRNLVILGILGKIVSATPMLVGIITITDRVPKLFIVPVVTDFTFIVLFLMFFVFATRNNRWRSSQT